MNERHKIPFFIILWDGLRVEGKPGTSVWIDSGEPYSDRVEHRLQFGGSWSEEKASYAGAIVKNRINSYIMKSAAGLECSGQGTATTGWTMTADYVGAARPR